jgi:hypothetical protein
MKRLEEVLHEMDRQRAEVVALADVRRSLKALRNA